jgi:hypothetical protein
MIDIGSEGRFPVFAALLAAEGDPRRQGSRAPISFRDELASKRVARVE